MDVASKGEQQDQLKRLVPLNTLSDENLTKLLGQVHIEQAGKGDFLFQEGDTDPQNIYLLSGKVALLLGAKEMDVVSAGTETARFALAHQLPRKYSGRAKTKIEYVRIDSRLLSDLLAQSPQESYRVSDIETELGDDWMSQLLQSRVFQQIPAANIQGVMMRMAEVEVKKGDEIVKQGDEGDYFYLINTGSCSVTHTTGNGGQPVEVARLGPGKSFGEEALLSDQPRSCTITMLSDGKLLRLSKQDFVDLIKRPLSKGLTYPQARTLVDKKDGVWLDVRSPEEYDKAHIRGSVNLPLNTIRIQSASLDSDRQYILYCNNGRQSAAAAYLLTGLDFNVEVLEEGLKEVPAEALENAKATPTATETNPAVQEESEGLAVDDIQEGGANEQPRKQVADLSAVRSVVEKAKAQIATLKKEKQEALAAQQQLQEKLKVLEQQHVDWHNQQESLEKALEEQRQHAKTLENAREEAEAKLQTLLQQQTDKRGDLEQEKGQLATALAEAEQGKSELQAQITALEEAREQQQARLSELENADEALGSTSAELARLKEELAALQTHSEQTETALAEAQQGKSELQAQITALEEAHEQQQLRLSELENADEALGSTSAELARLKEANSLRCRPILKRPK